MIELNPDYIDALKYRAKTLIILQHWAEAIEAINSYLYFDQNNLEFLVHKSEIQIALNLNLEANETYGQILEIDYNHFVANY